MSDAPDRENQTEAPTPKRLGKAWSEGEVPIGHDAVLVAGTAAGAVALVALAGALRAGLQDLFAFTAGNVDRMPFASLTGMALRPSGAALAVCAAAAAAATTATLAQTRGGFWTSRLAFDLGKLFSLGRLSRMFQKDFFIDLGIALAKVSALGAAAWYGLRDDLWKLPGILTAPLDAQLGHVYALLARAGKPVLVVAILLAAAELFITRWRFYDRLKMSKEEVKREAKDDEGDPLYRGKRKQKHRQILKNLAKVEVPRADALVVNPTHVAVAIRYRKAEGRAPRVTAKGKGVLADYMRSLAREHGVPIVQDVPLARLLYRKVKVGREIPAQTYKAVAAVLAFVYRVTGRSGGTAARAGAPGGRA